MDGGREHQRNQLVPLTEGQLCQKKTGRSKSSCYNQVRHQYGRRRIELLLDQTLGFVMTAELLFKFELLEILMVRELLHLYKLNYFTIVQ